MANRKRMILAVVAAAAVAIAVVFLFPSKEEKVNKQFALAEKYLLREEGESVITLATKAGNLAELASNPCFLDTPIPMLSGSMSRQEITSTVARLRMEFSTLTVRFDEQKRRIEFPESDRAEVLQFASLSGESRNVGAIDQQYEVTCTLEEIDGDWLFPSVKAVLLQ
jgi:hypothetical protein